MVDYNPKDWFTFIFRFHKADTFRKLLPMIMAIAAYSALVSYLELEYWNLSHNSHLRNLPTLHSLMGFVLSLLLVFRTNTAYDRWWEGRRLWGQLVNASRNMAIKLQAVLPAGSEDRAFFRRMIPNYAFSMKNHLRGQFRAPELEGLDAAVLNQEEHVPSQIAVQIFSRMRGLQSEAIISPQEMIVLNDDFKVFSDVCGGCERIKSTPIPYSYSAFLKKFIFVYVMTMPFGYVFILGYLTVPLVAFVFYVLASLELIAEEIEDPFGSDPNDLPSERICKTIRKDVHAILH